MSRLIKVELTKAVVIVQATYGQIKPSSGKNGTKSLILSLTMFEYPICSNPKSLPEVKKLSTRENTFYNYQISAVNCLLKGLNSRPLVIFDRTRPTLYH